MCCELAAAEPALLNVPLTQISTQSDYEVPKAELRKRQDSLVTRAVASPAKTREASRHDVIDAVVAPQDGSGPCRGVRHKKWHLGSISLKAHKL